MKKIGLALFSALFLVACDPDDTITPEPNPDPTPGQTDEPLEVKTIKTDAKDFATWTYYSIEKGGPVEIANPGNSLDWDIAFHRYDIRLNGGKSGVGKGEGIKLEETELDKVTEAPAEGYVKDEEGNIVIDYTTGNPRTEVQPYSKEVVWLDFMATGAGPSYTRHNNVFVIKTANGKYAKIKFLNYYDDRGKAGTVTWQYAIQQKGTRNLK